jgi:quercetin dioxygenase-like cupin family protein
MTPLSRTSLIGSLVLVASAVSAGEEPQTAPTAPPHAIVQPSDVKWKPLRPGAEIAVVSGDPDKTGAPFVLRMRYQGVVRVPPHWHPTDENITVLSGRFMIGHGERFDESAATELATGAYAAVPARTPHYAWSKGDTVVQVHGIGPFAINYVNPADDPNKAGVKK